MKIVLLTTSGFSNIGEESLVRHNILLMQAKHPKSNIICNSANPRRSQKLHKCSQVSFYKTASIRFLFHLLTATRIIIAGDEITSSLLDRYYQFRYLQGKARLFLACVAAILGKRVELHAIGMYSKQRSFPEKIFKTLLRKCAFISVRDRDSKQMLKRYTKRRVHIVSDPGYLLPVSDFARSAQLPRRFILVALSHDAVRSPAEIAAFLATSARQKKAMLLFLPFSRHPYTSAENDVLVHNALIHELQQLGVSSSHMRLSDPCDAKSVIAKAQAVISSRYHALVFAASLGVQFVALGSNPKIAQFFMQ